MIGKTNDKNYYQNLLESIIKTEITHIKEDWYIFLMCFFVARLNIIDEIFPFAILVLCVYCFVKGNSFLMLLLTIAAVLSKGFNYVYIIILIAVYSYFYNYKNEKKSILLVSAYASIVLFISKTTILLLDGFTVNKLMLVFFEAMFVYSGIILANELFKGVKSINKLKVNLNKFKFKKLSSEIKEKSEKLKKTTEKTKITEQVKEAVEVATTATENINHKVSYINEFKKTKQLNIFSDLAKTKIKEQLLWQNVNVKFFEVLPSNKTSVSLSVTVKTEKPCDEVEAAIELIVRNLTGVRLKCTDRVVASPNYYVLKFKNIKRIKIRTYSASAVKNGSEISGDSFAYAGRLDKYYTVLCDGIGSGEEAFNESNGAVDLLSKFMYTDFSEEQILRTLNSILMIKLGDERFVTFDFNIIDYGAREIRLYKAGAAPTYIVSKKNIDKIVGKSLPLGILDNFEYSSFKKKVDIGDIIIMVSDGIIDSIGLDDKKSLDKYLELIINKDPQTIANSILSYALRGQDKVFDDMTVLVTKIG